MFVTCFEYLLAIIRPKTCGSTIIKNQTNLPLKVNLIYSNFTLLPSTVFIFLQYLCKLMLEISLMFQLPLLLIFIGAWGSAVVKALRY